MIDQTISWEDFGGGPIVYHCVGDLILMGSRASFLTTQSILRNLNNGK